MNLIDRNIVKIFGPDWKTSFQGYSTVFLTAGVAFQGYQQQLTVPIVNAKVMAVFGAILAVLKVFVSHWQKDAKTLF